MIGAIQYLGFLLFLFGMTTGILGIMIDTQTVSVIGLACCASGLILMGDKP